MFYEIRFGVVVYFLLQTLKAFSVCISTGELSEVKDQTPLYYFLTFNDLLKAEGSG